MTCPTCLSPTACPAAAFTTASLFLPPSCGRQLGTMACGLCECLLGRASGSKPVRHGNRSCLRHDTIRPRRPVRVLPPKAGIVMVGWSTHVRKRLPRPALCHRSDMAEICSMRSHPLLSSRFVLRVPERSVHLLRPAPVQRRPVEQRAADLFENAECSFCPARRVLPETC